MSGDTVAFSYIDEKNIGDAYDESSKKFNPIAERINEWERIARNEPKSNLPKGFPRSTDGTTAAYISSRPKSVIQQIPTGVVTSVDKDKDLAGIAGLVLTEEIIPNANSSGTVIQKSWAALSKAMTYGAQPAFVFYTNRGDYYGADFKLPYVKHVIPEAGKVYDKDCNVMFMKAWYQPNDIRMILAKEKILSKQGVKSGWNAKALENLQSEAKSDEDKTPAERAMSLDTGGVEIVFAFQTGVGAKIYGYSLDTKEVVYVTKNLDPRGVIPIHYLYNDLDMSSPLGRGAVELVAGLQNMLDSEMQMYQYAQALGLNPPLIKRGAFDTSSIRFQQNAIWDLGTGPNNQLQPVNISTSALQNFPNNYGLIKSQMLALNNTSDNSISATVGNIAQSKTYAGVQASEQRVGLTDNHLRKQFEGWFGDVCETMLNVHFASSQGDREIELTEEYIKRQQLVNPDFASTSATVHYDEIQSGFKFKVDASTSKVSDDEKSIENLRGLLEIAQSSPQLQQYVRIDKLLNRIVTKLGVDDPEELVINPDENENGIPDAEEQMMEQPMEQPMEQMEVQDGLTA